MDDVITHTVIEILNDVLVMHLAVHDNDGSWVAPVIFVADGYDLYWVSMPHARHSRAIDTHAHVACSIVASDSTNAERALQIEGDAMRVSGDLLQLAQRIEQKRGKPLPVTEQDFLSKGHVWYKMRPTKIYLMHSALFGYERKSVQLK